MYWDDIKHFLNNAEFGGIDFGVRLGIGFTFWKIYSGAFYEHGLMDVADNDIHKENGFKTNNIIWTFTIDYDFPIKKEYHCEEQNNYELSVKIENGK
ncbi:MAG: hypothetical protein LBC68_05010 [Prevotellaceae bacterium]|nr:hypothetical protein [Prevotellaceae bacterium]